jgi:serine kinase of HPr protein (carbohydrate metabolism regulator)
LIVTKNKFNEISKLCEDSIHNIDFTGIELPGYFSNKIEEPTEENILYISKFESEYSQKFNCDARSKVLIKCSNDKLLNFILINQNANENFDMKI